MELIDKAAIVVEIENCYNECLKKAKIVDADYWNGHADAYRNVLTILDDTLEVKDVGDAYKQGYNDAIDKACKWLKHNFNMPDDFESHLKKAMEQ